MIFKDLVKKARSYRRFDESIPISHKDLVELVDTARFTPCGRNAQTLRYMIISETDQCAAIFPCTAWAGSLPEWPGPEEGERPVAYIAILTREANDIDVGIAAQTMQLAAAEKGIGCCQLGSIKRAQIAELLGIPESMTVRLLLAFGYPGETIVLEEAGADESLVYYRSSDDVHHVPKLGLDDILLQR